MAERGSGYARIERDAYWTPTWVFDALYAVECFTCPFDAAPRDATFDFLTQEWIDPPREIVTNPPYSLAEAFVRRALALADKTAMLLPIAFDAAKGRRDLFESAPFKAKYTLVKRIRWENIEQKKAGPSQNHAWFVWERGYQGKPFMGWLPVLPDCHFSPTINRDRVA